MTNENIDELSRCNELERQFTSVILKFCDRGEYIRTDILFKVLAVVCSKSLLASESPEENKMTFISALSDVFDHLSMQPYSHQGVSIQ